MMYRSTPELRLGSMAMAFALALSAPSSLTAATVYQDAFETPGNGWYFYPLHLGQEIVCDPSNIWEYAPASCSTRAGCYAPFSQQPWHLPWPQHVISNGAAGWWSDPHHEMPLNIVAFDNGLQLDLAQTRFRARIQTQSLAPLKSWTNQAGQTKQGHLYFWFQTEAHLPNGTACAPRGSGGCKNTDYVFSKVNIEETPGITGGWTTVSFNLTSNPADWTCIGCWNGGSGSCGRANTCDRYRSSSESLGIATDLRKAEAIGFVIYPAPEDPDGSLSNTGKILIDDVRITRLPVPDFNGDGKADILWRHQGDGQNYVWYMNGAARIGNGIVTGLGDLNWHVVGLADFDGDDKTDILWRHQGDGRNYAWFMNGPTYSGGANLPTLADVGWRIAGTGDFDGDGKADILWRKEATGENYVWFMDGAAQVGGIALPGRTDTAWKIAGIGDMDANGWPDIVWRNVSTGQNEVWLMKEAVPIGTAGLPPLGDTAWRIAAVVDMNGDAYPDLLWRNTSNGQNYVWFMNGMTMAGGAGIDALNDQSWTIVPAEF